jgi:hypothetical protein
LVNDVNPCTSSNSRPILLSLDLSLLLVSPPHPLIRRYAVTDGSRYFWEARFVCSTFDASPQALKETERLLRNEEGVLKFFTVKLKTAVDRSKATSYKNPYLHDLLPK